MKSEIVDFAQVSLLQNFIDALLKLCAAFDDDLSSALEARLANANKSRSTPAPETSLLNLPPQKEKYFAEFLGVRFAEWTLPEVFAQIVDMTADVAPEALVQLSEVSSRSRRFVARSRDAIHPRNNRLPVMQTSSGWWISKNIGQADLNRALAALCDVTGLSLDIDIKFAKKK